MKLKLLLLTLFFSAVSLGQTVIDNTATGAGGTIPASWTGQNNTGNPISQTAGGGYYLVESTTGGIYDYLLSDLYTSINGATSVVITFDIATYGSGTNSPLSVDMSLDGGSTWVSTQTSGGTPTSSTFISTSVTFSGPIASSNVQFRFYDAIAGNKGVRIKNIVISAFLSSTFTVTYDGNGNDGGTVPTDSNTYNSGDTVTVLGNTGSLTQTGFTFNGWNTANDGSGIHYNGGDTFSITINTILYAEWLSTAPPVITSSLTASGTTGVAFTYDIIATNTPTSYNATGLPAGLSINTATGQITGTPGVTGVFNVTISATNVNGTDTQTLVITVTTGPCFSEDFSSTAGWTDNGSSSDSVSGHFGASAPCRAMGTGDNLISPSVDNPSQLQFFQDASSGGNGQTATVDYSLDGGATWVALYSFTVTDAGNTETVDLTNVGGVNLSSYTGVIFRFNSSFNTWYLDDVNVFCGPPADVEIDIQGNGISIVDGDTTPATADDTDFGSTFVGVDVSHTFTIYNSGTDPLTISGITITGADAGDFYISLAAAGSVPGGGSTTFEVTYNPSALGVSNATISVDNNDANENPYTFNITGEAVTCTPTTSVSSISPTTGPVGTIVTINGSGFLTATDVHFGALASSFTIISDSQIQATVPANATTGDVVIYDASCDYSYSNFVVIVSDKSSCEPSGTGISELFISEVTDASTGSLSYIQIYNATGATVDMTNYEVYIRNNGSATGDDIPLTGTLANGATFVLATSAGTQCAVPGGDGSLADQNDVSSGVNNNDCIHLAKLGTVIDTWGYCDGSSWINALGLGSAGYDFKRNPDATPLPTTAFDPNDWTIIDFNACSDDYSLINTYEGIKTPPLTSVPNYTYDCSTNSVVISVTGTEAVAGGAGLMYQWFVSAPGDSNWTSLADGGVYSGTTTSDLTISDISGLDGYQYYCQVMEDTATCFVASNAVSIGLGSAATVWNGTTWSNGTPTLSTVAAINGNYDTTANGSFECCSLVVNAGFTLDIQAADYVLIENNLTVNGNLTVHNNGSLVQINDAGVNTGNISYERITTGNTFDYVYWSSPVDGANAPSGYVYTWATTVANTNGGEGNWVAASGASMAAGVGYIMRDVFSRTFTGVARNGVITPTIQRGTYQGADYAGINGTTITRFDDNWNLVGNPYPSAISAEDFLLANTNIEGAVRIWTHSTSPSTAISNPFYGTFIANYTPTDYITYNGSGTVSGPAGFNGYIGGGQSFLVNMIDGSTTSGTVTFNNALRSKAYDNSQFYRQANPSGNYVQTGVEKNRIWLDIINSNNVSDRTLVGYISGATEAKDRMYDAVTAVKTSMRLYSIIDEDKMTIQGRRVPFDAKDKVQMGYYAPANGTYSIAIAAVDGLFTGSQDIYLEDTELNVIHDLRQAPYSFYAATGENNTRFVLRYTTNTLSADEFAGNENDITIASAESLTINSNVNVIKQVTIHNVLGQLLFNKQVNTQTLQVDGISKSNQALIVEVILENNERIVRKVIF